jgi:uncharacterized glyoxalase superfamily protein PhnB
MTSKVVPMIHVPDVRAAVEWYQTVGFTVQRMHEEEGVMSWALLTFGDRELMFNTGGRRSAEHRREVDLYLHVENVEELYRQLKDRVEVVEELHDVEYGMREFIIRDLNRFWITFGEPLR